MSYPETCLQSLMGGPWWIEEPSAELCSGRLARAIIPYRESLCPYVLEAERKSSSPTEHTILNPTLRELPIGQWDTRQRTTPLPIAALPRRHDEVYLVSRGKRRPVVIFDLPVPPGDMGEKYAWLGEASCLIIPCTSVKRDLSAEFLNRVKCCEYPQFFWDLLPLKNLEKGARGSLLLFQRVLSCHSSDQFLEATPYKLSDDALGILQEWLEWVIKGVPVPPAEPGNLDAARGLLEKEARPADQPG